MADFVTDSKLDAETISEVERVRTPTEKEKELLPQLEELTKHYCTKYASGSEVADYSGIGDMCKLRFLRGEKHDPKKAAKKLASHVIWRRDKNIRGIVEGDFSHIKERKTVHLGFKDKSGRPGIILLSRNHDKTVLDPEQKEKDVIYIFNTAINEGLGDERVSFFFDMYNFSVWKNMDYELIKCLVGVLQNQYPDTLQQGILFDAPFVFRACWAVIRPWLDPVTAAKIKFESSDQLANYVDPTTLPAAWYEGK
jgi:hypothetical protein